MILEQEISGELYEWHWYWQYVCGLRSQWLRVTCWGQVPRRTVLRGQPVGPAALPSSRSQNRWCTYYLHGGTHSLLACHEDVRLVRWQPRGSGRSDNSVPHRLCPRPLRSGNEALHHLSLSRVQRCRFYTLPSVATPRHPRTYRHPLLVVGRISSSESWRGVLHQHYLIAFQGERSNP